MATHEDLLKSIDVTLKILDSTLSVAGKIPPGTRVNVVRSQLELAREIVVKARGYATAKSSSGSYNAAELQGLMKEPKK